MGRIAVTEDIEGIRDEEDVEDPAEDGEPDQDAEGGEAMTDDKNEDGERGEMEIDSVPKTSEKKKGKYVATLAEVHIAFDSINVLRYQQPCHLQGTSLIVLNPTHPHTTCRQGTGHHYHRIQRRPHPWWYDMEDPLTRRWNNSLCGKHQPHARAPSRRNGTRPSWCKRCI
jgi:hypothetical protein